MFAKAPADRPWELHLAADEERVGQDAAGHSPVGDSAPAASIDSSALCLTPPPTGALVDQSRLDRAPAHEAALRIAQQRSGGAAGCRGGDRAQARGWPADLLPAPAIQRRPLSTTPSQTSPFIGSLAPERGGRATRCGAGFVRLGSWHFAGIGVAPSASPPQIETRNRGQSRDWPSSDQSRASSQRKRTAVYPYRFAPGNLRFFGCVC